MPDDSAPSILILMGSARSNGRCRLAVDQLMKRLPEGAVTCIDLLPLALEPFRYDGTPERDDFAWICRRMAAHRDIVLATPVYWYAMSGVMKTFFDRLTDLLGVIEGRRIGRALHGRGLWLLANGNDGELPLGFVEPFRRTASYFAMDWRGCCYLPDGPAAGALPSRRAPLLDSFAAAIARSSFPVASA